MDAQAAVEELDTKQVMKNKTLYTVPARSAISLVSDWIRGGQLPHWPQFSKGTAISTYKCRSAIALTCNMLGLKEADEVLVPSYNCGSEIDPIIKQKIRVRFYRIDERAQIDIDNLADGITKKTRAILVTHYFGWPQDMDPLVQICKEKGLFLIEDCAHALFSASNKQWLGNYGDVAVYSLAKMFPIPHGGVAVFSNIEDLEDVHLRSANIIQSARDCLNPIRRSVLQTLGTSSISSAAVRRWRSIRVSMDEPTERNGGLPDIPREYYYENNKELTKPSRMICGALAAIDANEVIERRRNNYQRLSKIIEDINTIEPLYKTLPQKTCPLHLPIVVSQRDNWVKELTERGVYSLPWWSGYHSDCNWAEYPEAMMLKNSIVTLPIHQGLTNPMIDQVGECVIEVARKLNKVHQHIHRNGAEISNRSISLSTIKTQSNVAT